MTMVINEEKSYLWHFCTFYFKGITFVVRASMYDE